MTWNKLVRRWWLWCAMVSSLVCVVGLLSLSVYAILLRCCTDAATFTNLIVGCNHAGKYDQAFQVFDYMRTVQLSYRLAACLDPITHT